MHGQRRLDRHDELWCRQDGATGCGHDCRDCLCRGDGSSCEGGCGCGRGSRCGSGRCGEEEANASGNGSGSANRSCGGGSGNASRGFEAWASGSGCGCEIDSVRGRGQGNARIEEIASASARPWLQSGRVAGARPWEVGGWEVAGRMRLQVKLWSSGAGTHDAQLQWVLLPAVAQSRGGSPGGPLNSSPLRCACSRGHNRPAANKTRQ